MDARIFEAKIKELRDKIGSDPLHPEDLQDILDWENAYREEQRAIGLYKNETIKKFVDTLKKVVQEIKDKLADDYELQRPDNQSLRHFLFLKKEMYQQFVSIFTDAPARAEDIEQTVDNELRD